MNLALLLNTEDDELLLRLKGEIEKQASIARMERYFQDLKTYYQQDNLQAARQELEKITAEITSKTSQ